MKSQEIHFHTYKLYKDNSGNAIVCTDKTAISGVILENYQSLNTACQHVGWLVRKRWKGEV